MIPPLASWSSEKTLATFHNGEFEVWYAGRKVQKTREDLARLKMGIGIGSPEVIIETGTRWGGSAGFFHEVGRGAQVISIDIDSKLGWTGRNFDVANRNIQYFDADSLDDKLFETVSELVAGRRAMVVLDSDHHYPHVIEEIRLWAPLVGVGCHLVIEDGCFDLWQGEDSRRGGRMIPEAGGPLKAISEWADFHSETPPFVRDVEIEGAFAISHSPCGWWRRS